MGLREDSIKNFFDFLGLQEFECCIFRQIVICESAISNTFPTQKWNFLGLLNYLIYQPRKFPKDRIVHYFSHRANSGFVEGFNNKLRVITRRYFGIRKLGILVRRLWLDVRGYWTVLGSVYFFCVVNTQIPKEPTFFKLGSSLDRETFCPFDKEIAIKNLLDFQISRLQLWNSIVSHLLKGL